MTTSLFSYDDDTIDRDAPGSDEPEPQDGTDPPGIEALYCFHWRDATDDDWVMVVDDNATRLARHRDYCAIESEVTDIREFKLVPCGEWS